MQRLDLFPLSDNWIPPKLLVRDAQLRALIENAELSYPMNFWIHGARGLGKTLTVTVFGRMKENVFYHPFQSKSIKDEIKKFCLRLGYVKRTYESEAEAVVRAMEKYGAPKEATIVFDDVDTLEENIRANLSIFLHGLWDTLTQEGWKFSIHLISTHDLEWAHKKLDGPTLSRLGLRPLHFPPYTREEIKRLLLQRLEYIDGLEFTEPALEVIVDTVAEFGGDFREALRYVRAVVEKHGKLTFDTVAEGIIPMASSFFVDRIRDLSYPCALLLPSIAHLTFLRHSQVDGNIRAPEDIRGEVFPVSWDDVKNAYTQLCEKYGVPRQHNAMLYYWLEQLYLKEWIDKFTLAKRSEYNYKGRRCLFVRLKVPYPHLLEAIKRIDWENPW
jgi:Cdc6-like AAA superfamily ATPase